MGVEILPMRKVIVGPAKKRYSVIIPGRWRKSVGMAHIEENAHPNTCCPDCSKKLGKVRAWVLTPVRYCETCRCQVEG